MTGLTVRDTSGELTGKSTGSLSIAKEPPPRSGEQGFLGFLPTSGKSCYGEGGFSPLFLWIHVSFLENAEPVKRAKKSHPSPFPLVWGKHEDPFPLPLSKLPCSKYQENRLLFYFDIYPFVSLTISPCGGKIYKFVVSNSLKMEYLYSYVPSSSYCNLSTGVHHHPRHHLLLSPSPLLFNIQIDEVLWWI